VPRRRIVLLVEPDLEAQSAFRSALEARGFQVWAATDAASALAVAQERQPRVIIEEVVWAVDRPRSPSA
jgi:CheY-like chemotaxis protein